MFPKVINGASYWEIVKRYKEFEALKSYIETQEPSSLDLTSQFPGKSIWRVRGNSLATRRMKLQNFMDSLLRSNLINVASITDALSSFLEVRIIYIFHYYNLIILLLLLLLLFLLFKILISKSLDTRAFFPSQPTKFTFRQDNSTRKNIYLRRLSDLCYNYLQQQE